MEPCPGTATQRTDEQAAAAGPRRAGLRSHPTAGLSGAAMSRYRACRPAHGAYRRRSPPLRLDPPSKAPGLTLSGLKYYHDPHVISQPDKPPINIRLIHHLLQCGMWIITDFSLYTGVTRALPGKCPLLVPASLRNPQHFHRLCTGLAPLRTSHPHVCAQTTGKQSSCRLAGSSGSAPAPAQALVCRPAGRVRESGHAGPVARPLPGRGQTSATAGLTSSAAGSQVEGHAAPSSAPA